MKRKREKQGPQNKAMKLTSLSAAPGLRCTSGVDRGAASYPRCPGTAGTGSQLIAGVLRTHEAWTSAAVSPQDPGAVGGGMAQQKADGSKG